MWALGFRDQLGCLRALRIDLRVSYESTWVKFCLKEAHGDCPKLLSIGGAVFRLLL